MKSSFASHSPKRLVGLVTGAGEMNANPWPAPNRSIVSRRTRAAEREEIGWHTKPGFWRHLVRTRVANGSERGII